MHRGYIHLWRRMEEHPFCNERRPLTRLEAWLWLLRNAQYGESKLLAGTGAIKLKRGELVCTLTELADEWRWTKSKVRRFMGWLRVEEMIRLDSDTKATRISICNYDRYQPTRNEAGTVLKRLRNDDETTVKRSVDTPEEKFYRSKKGRKLTGDILQWFNDFWKVFNYMKGKAEAADAFLDVPDLCKKLVYQEIIPGAKVEARKRPALIEAGKTPKMAQGWLSGRRWEDKAGPSPLAPSPPPQIDPLDTVLGRGKDGKDYTTRQGMEQDLRRKDLSPERRATIEAELEAYWKRQKK